MWVCSVWWLAPVLSCHSIAHVHSRGGPGGFSGDIEDKSTYKHCTNSSSISKRVKPPYFGSCASS